MSRRFGRQQKRKLRSELALAKDDNLSLSNKLKTSEMLSARSREENAYVRRLLAANSAMLPPKIHHAVIADVKQFMMPGVTTAEMSYSPYESMYHEYIKNIPMHVLLTDIRKYDTNDAIHFYAELADGSVTYAISERAISMTSKELLTENIAKALAKQLANYLKS